MSDDALDRLYAAFAEFMTPDENGEPLLLTSDVRHAIEAAGFPAQLAPQLKQILDPRGKGSITFEQFSQVCLDLENSTNKDANDSRDSDESDSSAAGGFDPDDFDDDDDEDFVDDNDDAADDDEAGSVAEDPKLSDDELPEDLVRDHIFDVLKDQNGEITVNSLRSEANRLKFTVPTSDLEQMVQMATTKTEFAELWQRLQ